MCGMACAGGARILAPRAPSLPSIACAEVSALAAFRWGPLHAWHPWLASGDAEPWHEHLQARMRTTAKMWLKDIRLWQCRPSVRRGSLSPLGFGGFCNLTLQVQSWGQILCAVEHLRTPDGVESRES